MKKLKSTTQQHLEWQAAPACNKKQGKLRWRISRMQLLAHMMEIFTASMLFIVFLVRDNSLEQMLDNYQFLSLMALFALALMLRMLHSTIRRLNDLGHSGWWSAIGILPLVYVFLYAYLLLAKGSDSKNVYGLAPVADNWYDKLFGRVLPLVLLLVLIYRYIVPN